MTYRCFIAINLLNEAKLALQEMLQALKNTNSSRFITYTKPENIHITLQFLGNVDIKKIPEVKEVVKKVANQNIVFHLELGDFETFPNFYNPRVLYIGVKGDVETANKIQNELGKELFHLGFISDERAWVPHFTLARIKSRVRLDLNVKIPKIHFPVESIELMRSELSSRGPRYSVLESIGLKK